MRLFITLSKRAIMMIVVCGFIGLLSSPANADTFSFVGTTTGGSAANATATITGSAGSNLLTITLTNNLTNIVTRGSAISGLSFQVKVNGSAINLSPVIVSQSGRLVTFNDSTPNDSSAIDVGANGSAADPLGWRLSSTSPTLYLNGLGAIGSSGTNPPDELIIGPPTTGLIWASANGSIIISDPAQPFVNTTAVFTVNIGTPLPSGFQFSNVTLYFGTNADRGPGTFITQVPEPASMLLLGTGLIGVFTRVRRRKSARE